MDRAKESIALPALRGVPVPDCGVFLADERPDERLRCVLYSKGARLITGDDSAPIENSAFIVEKQPLHTSRAAAARCRFRLGQCA